MYTLEPPRRDVSNENLQSMFWNKRMRKIEIPQFSIYSGVMAKNPLLHSLR